MSARKREHRSGEVVATPQLGGTRLGNTFTKKQLEPPRSCALAEQVRVAHAVIRAHQSEAVG